MPPGVKRQAERLAPAEVWTLALGFGLAILAQRVARWLQVTMHRHTMVLNPEILLNVRLGWPSWCSALWAGCRCVHADGLGFLRP